jgi:hypothetical protein
MLPLLNSGKLVLLDNQRLVNQLVGLERRTARGGRDVIDHSPGGHDDIANCVAGFSAQPKPTYDHSMDWVSGPYKDEPARNWRHPLLPDDVFEDPPGSGCYRARINRPFGNMPMIGG